jgi:hypothetical protein
MSSSGEHTETGGGRELLTKASPVGIYPSTAGVLGDKLQGASIAAAVPVPRVRAAVLIPYRSPGVVQSNAHLGDNYSLPIQDAERGVERRGTLPPWATADTLISDHGRQPRLLCVSDSSGGQLRHLIVRDFWVGTHVVATAHAVVLQVIGALFRDPGGVTLLDGAVGRVSAAPATAPHVIEA